MLEIDQQFRSFDEWKDWSSKNSFVYNQAFADEVGARILKQGILEPLTNTKFTAEAISHEGTNWREGLICDRISSRVRAVLKCLAGQLKKRSAYDVTMFAAEAITPFALKLRGLYPRFLGSEYGADEEVRRRLFPIQHQDLTNLDLPDNSFEIALTNEVLEHVPDIDASLREMARVLKPGGWHLGTHPFMLISENSIRKAELKDGKVVHILPPEYHGNPVDPSGGSLVFEVPGWDILERTRNAGFQDAFMRFIASEKHGILTSNTGVFVLCARKAP